MARRSKAPKVPATGTAAANVARFSTRATPLPPIALALQGGGAHGAFTWGVLDRLLAEPGLRLVAASGASAGALNAAVLASGLVEGGPDAARAKLSALWHRVSALARLIPRRPDPFEHVAPSWNAEWAFPNSALDLLMRFASPYQFNPLGLNPLRDVLVDLVDFERLRGRKALRLLIAATNVETSAGRIFANEELSPDVLLASACLPTLNQAVKLGDGYYWDGGFTANPPILPLVELGLADDLVLVRVNPTREEGVPTDPQAIRTRLSRIAFESPLKRELEIVERLGAMSGESDAPDALGRRLRRLRLHTVADDATMARLDQSSRLQPDAALMRHLAEAGRAAAGRWLEAFRTEVAMRPAARLERAG
ncbi:MAG TPA: patatin-like phospholipase family protein [Alphaproteobacteria bacterium]|nr:patatin-like phospholipase family protein [Alphaproteobacteria bacterium]